MAPGGHHQEDLGLVSPAKKDKIPANPHRSAGVEGCKGVLGQDGHMIGGQAIPEESPEEGGTDNGGEQAPAEV